MSRISGFGNASYSAIVQQAASRRAGAAKKAGGAQQVSKTQDPFQVDQPKAAEKLDTALQSVGNLQENADKMVIDLASGQDVNVHNTMVELEKADIALKYTVQLRNRALSAYEELMRIQV
jgi:flagellar hook-basal body complex protein FliE